MSLIDDALKRAREEAARQDEAARRTKRPWIPPEPPRPRRSAALLFAAIVGMGLAAGASWLWLRRSRAPAQPPSAPAAASRTSPRRDVRPPAPLETVVVASPGGPGAETGREKAEAATPAPAPHTRKPPASLPEKTATTAPPPAPETTRAEGGAPSALPALRPRGPGSFVRVASLPGGGRMELEGIVYSETHPVALIDGKVLAPGAYAGDFEIVAIEENRVHLRGRGTTFWITLQ